MNRFGDHEADLLATIISAFPDPAELAEFTTIRLGVNLETISAPGTLNKRVGDMIAWFVANGRDRELLTAVAEARPKAESLQLTISNCEAHLDRIEPKPWYRSADPVEACILRGKRALFNRDGLRRHMKELLADEGANVLVVRGERGAGCSHSRHLIVHLAAALQSFKVIPVDLDTLGHDAAPSDLIRNMAARLMCSLDTMPPQHGQPARWNLELCAWFTAQVDSREHQTWVVIDGLEHGPSQSEALELLKQLAVMAEDETRLLRVIFLGLPDTLPGNVESGVLQEQVIPPGDETLDEFFARFFNHRDADAEPQAIREAADNVRALAGDEPEGRLRRLSEYAVQVAKRLADAQAAG